VIAVAPLYSAYQSYLTGDLWLGVLAGLAVSAALLALTEATAFGLRRLRRRAPEAR
jgi:hypothetical protein